MSPRQTNLLLMLSSLTFTLFASEGILRLFPVAAFRIVRPDMLHERNWFEFHPELSYTLLRDYNHTFRFMDDDCTERSVDIATNSLGVRDIELVRSDDWPLVAFIGDSFTEGYHIDADATFAGLAKEQLQGRYDVINLGVHNYDAVDYSRMALWAQREFEPSHLFIGLFVGNDVFPYNRGAYAPQGIEKIPRALWSSSFLLNWISYALKLESPASAPPEPTPAAAPAPTTEPASIPDAAPSIDGSARQTAEPPIEYDFYDDFLEPECRTRDHSRYVRDYIQFRKTPGKTRFYHNPWLSYTASRSTIAVLQHLQGQLKTAKLHIFLFPERLQMSDREWEWLSTIYPNLYRQRTQMTSRLARDMESQGIPFTDMTGLLDESCYLRFDGHFSEEGHRRVARRAIELLEME